MKRRRFIKIAGGGVILAAMPATGCNSGLPDEAIRPWKTAGQPDDVRKWALSHAILAPHSHNLQSWLVDLSTPGEIVLFCDLTRLLPETDPMYRQIVMSQGTFLELFEIAAREKGYRSDIELFPDGTYGPDTIDKRAVARIRLVEHPSVLKDPLFSQILKRRTNREEYDASRDIPKPAIEAMAASIDPYIVKFGFAGTEDSAMMEKQRALAKEAWRIELTTPAKILETYRYLRIGPDEIAKYRDGISINDPFLGFLVKLGLFDRSKAPAPDSFATTGQIETFNKNLSTTPGFLWMITEGNTREQQIDAGRAFVRVQLAATAHDLVMQPLSQALQEYPEMTEQYQAIHTLLGAPRPDFTVQMWARVGYGPVIEPAPRRSLESHIL